MQVGEEAVLLVAVYAPAGQAALRQSPAALAADRQRRVTSELLELRRGGC